MPKLKFLTTNTIIKWIGGLLLLDGVVLMLTGKFSVGVLVPAAVGAVFVALSWRWLQWQSWLQGSIWRRRIWRATCWGFGMWIVSLIAFFILLITMNQRSEELDLTSDSTKQPKAIVILGSGTPNATPSITLVARLNTGLQWANQFPTSVVVVSGGIDFGETISEAQVMGDYLRQKNLSPTRIIQEEASTSTYENLKFSQPLLNKRGVNSTDAILIITSDFHTLRSGMIARRAGFENVTMAGSSTPLAFRYNAWLREYFAFGVGWMLNEY